MRLRVVDVTKAGCTDTQVHAACYVTGRDNKWEVCNSRKCDSQGTQTQYCW